MFTRIIFNYRHRCRTVLYNIAMPFSEKILRNTKNRNKPVTVDKLYSRKVKTKVSNIILEEPNACTFERHSGSPLSQEGIETEEKD